MKHLLIVLVAAVVVLVAPGNLWGQATQPAYALWDGNETVTDYAKRAGIQNVQIELKLDANISVKLTLIPAGKFLMGRPESESGKNPDGGPQHATTISKPFYMGIYETTQEQYEAVMASSPSKFKGPTNPVGRVSWDDAMEFCKKLSAQRGNVVQLPTEAQWEYACRAGTTTPFNTGKTITSDQANYYATSIYDNGPQGEFRHKTMPVGSFKPNGFGLFDMHGNVGEWCADWYDETYYARAKRIDPQGPDSGQLRVLRGGYWLSDPTDCRSAARYGRVPDFRSDGLGFRMVMPAEDLK